jgi:hypothetical protein
MGYVQPSDYGRFPHPSSRTARTEFLRMSALHRTLFGISSVRFRIVEPELRVLRPLCQLRLRLIYIHRHQAVAGISMRLLMKVIVLLSAFVKVQFLTGSDYYADSALLLGSLVDLGTYPSRSS